MMTRRARLMASVVALSIVALPSGCRRESAAAEGAQPASSAPSASPRQSSQSAPAVAPERVGISGTRFVLPGGAPFVWRGITAFRLVEQIARGNERDAIAFLDWAAASRITVVRVLTLARHLFELEPAAGLQALPRLLELAAARGMHVEIVALADTGDLKVDVEAHLTAVGAVAARHSNAFVEIANEPFHPTQHARLHTRANLTGLAALVPGEVVTAFGSDAPESSGGGDYVTVHLPRGETPWAHVTALAVGRALVNLYRRPVVSDEPMGAADAAQPGRRDDSPERFRAAALLTRMTGMYGTFHYEGGLQARVASATEQACLDAWNEAWTLLPEGIEAGEFRQLDRARGAAFESRHAGEVWVLTVAGAPAPAGLSLVKRWPASALYVSRP
ncbi:MAG: hypothetical protein M3R55_00085 [Acidobacteriota bacterium]|nr:hypothetical protein [Acidobacteriota bacterium]